MMYAPYQSAVRTSFPRLRTVVRPDLAALPDAELAEAITGELSADPDDLESFLSGLQQFGNAVLQRLPSIASGAATGASMGAFGGPITALLGGLGGAIAGGLTAPPPGARPQAAGPQPAQAGPAPPVGAPPIAGGAAGSLMGLLANPAVQAGLMQMVMGRTGGKQVTLPSGEEIPTPAFAELIREVADSALAEYAMRNGEVETEELPEYLQRDHRGRGSREDPLLRAAVLLKLLEPPTTVVPVATPAQPAMLPPPAGVPGTAPPAAYGPPAMVPPAAGPPGASPFTAYTPPDLGVQTPTVYSLDQSYQDQVNRAWADWEFDQTLEDVLGGPRGGQAR
jgi:hypothetical protein